MNKISMVYWQENDYWIGYLLEFPDYRTQGETLEELKENILDIHREIITGGIGEVHKASVMELNI
ncbi:MAG: type II toxin-antitoxin system HicB family antitoxin [Brevinematales bacterium]|nr:type II toxin-antitoxin system HicB family antitoxin [Brevinematales bacterium]